MKRTRDQIIVDSINEGYTFLESGKGNYEASVNKFKSQGYDVRYWYMNRAKDIADRTYDIYGILKSSKTLVPMPGADKLSELKDIVFDIDPENMSCFGKMLGMSSLAKMTDVESVSKYSARQRKAQKNIKYCANDQWAFVNSWYDQKDEDARNYMLDAEELFSTVYSDSLENIYSEGSCQFSQSASKFMQEIKFCGKKFLETVTFFYVVKLMEEAFGEVEGTMEDAQRIMNQLTKIKERVGC